MLRKSVDLEKSGTFSSSFFRWNGTRCQCFVRKLLGILNTLIAAVSPITLYFYMVTLLMHGSFALIPTSHMSYFSVSPGLWCGPEQGFSARCVWYSWAWCWGGSCDGRCPLLEWGDFLPLDKAWEAASAHMFPFALLEELIKIPLKRSSIWAALFLSLLMLSGYS